MSKYIAFIFIIIFFNLYFLKVNGCGLNGMGLEAINLYRQMPKYLYDEATHIFLLNACSHSGLLNEARLIFNEITTRTERIVTALVCFFDSLCLI